MAAAAVATLWASHAAAQFTFVDVADAAFAPDSTLVQLRSVAWGDLNADGELDVLVNRAGGDGRSWLFLGDATGASFVDATASHAPGLAAPWGLGSALVVADFNNDGANDFVRTHPLELFLSAGPGGSMPYQFDVPGFSLNATDDFGVEGVAAVDIDRDGWLDLVFESAQWSLAVARNPADGSTNFEVLDSWSQPLPGPTSGAYLATADFDGDSDIDVFLRAAERNAELWLNTGQGLQQTLAFITDSNALDGSVAACDADADSDMDIVWTDVTEPTQNRVYFNSTGFFFEQHTLAVASLAAVCADFDNDGLVDIMQGQDGHEVVFENTLVPGDAGFGPPLPLGQPSQPQAWAMAVGDLGRDGDLDVLVATDSGLRLWRNDHNSDDYLIVRVLADVGTCPDAPRLRYDLGATVRLRDPDGALVGGVRQVGGGARGSYDEPIAHFGLADSGGPDLAYRLEVAFHYGDEPSAELTVTPSSLGSYQQLTVVHNDLDGDSLRTDAEVADGETSGVGPDVDGDDIPNWLDDDSDGDGLSDADEAGDSSPCTAAADADDDAIPNYLDVDSDNDGLEDGVEVTVHGTEPYVPDTDGGGVPDGVEVERGTDPLDPSDDDPDAGFRFAGNGCQCRSLAGHNTMPPWLLALVPALLLVRRRRRAQSTR